MKLEISEKTYNLLSENITGALAVIPTIRGIVPPYITERLEGCLTKAKGAVGDIAIIQEESHEAAH